MNAKTKASAAIEQPSIPAEFRFEVGDGATVTGYSDATAYTVVRVMRDGWMIEVREDFAELLNGSGSGEPDALQFSPGGFVGHTSGVQRWKTTPNPDGYLRRFSLRRFERWNGEIDHRWIEVGSALRSGARCYPGRSPHYDFNY